MAPAKRTVTKRSGQASKTQNNVDLTNDRPSKRQRKNDPIMDKNENPSTPVMDGNGAPDSVVDFSGSSRHLESAQNEERPPATTTNTKADANFPPSTSIKFPGGAFDLYGMPLPFLQKALKSTPTSEPDYAALYAKIVHYQNKGNTSGQIAIRVPSDNESKGYGRFSSWVEGFTEPFGDEPYDIGLGSVEQVDKLNLTRAEKRELLSGYDVPLNGNDEGVVAAMVLAEDMCGVGNVSGEFKMFTAPVWKDGNESGRVMYQGVLSFNVRYGGLYRHKGFGSGTEATFAFWAVPSREDEGLDCEELSHLAYVREGVDGGGAGDDYGYGMDDWLELREEYPEYRSHDR